MGLLSVIIPTYNESSNMAALAGSLRNMYGDFETIIADGGSSDGTAEAARAVFSAAAGRACVEKGSAGRFSWKLTEAPKGRAMQMNAGAAAACGDVFLFLHADSLLPSDTPALIEKAVRSGSGAGCFRLSFEPAGPLLKMAAFMSDMRVRYRGIAFGDQGIFVTRGLFEKLGGFPPIPLMEDYSFSETLSKKTRIVLLPAHITTSSRRFQKHGVLRTLIKMQYVQHLWRKGVSAEKIADIYRR